VDPLFEKILVHSNFQVDHAMPCSVGDFPVPWGQILARDERQEQGQLEEEYA
jgi:hypothetical protein